MLAAEVWSAAAATGLAGIVAAVLGAAAVWSLLRFNFCATPAAPPVVRSWVPWAGSIASFGMDPLLFVKRQRELLGNVFTVKLLGNRVTVLAHPSCHETFFMSRNAVLSPREVYTFMTPIFGKGVCYDAEYGRMREQFQHIAAQLGQKNFERHVPIIQREVRDFMAKNLPGDSGRINLLDEVGKLLISTSTTCLMGKDVAGRLTPGEMAQILSDTEHGINPVQVFFPYCTLPMPGMFAMKRSLAKWDRTIREIMCARSSGGYDGADILNGLLSARYRDGTGMSDRERVGIMFGTMFAGQHTSVNVAAYTLLHLCAKGNERHLQRHRDELAAIAEDLELDYERVTHMEFTHACVKESLRMHPPLIMLMRKVLEPVSVGGYTIPRGDIAAVSTWLSHRTEEVYTDCDTWDPTRFSDRQEGGGFGQSLDFIGFGGGAHRCLGAKFGTMQNQIAISLLLSEYDFELENVEVPLPDLTNMVVGPMTDKCWVRYRRRQ